MALASLVSFQEQKQSQKQQYFARRHSLITFSNISIKSGFSEGNKRTFIVTLVDTR